MDGARPQGARPAGPPRRGSRSERFTRSTRRRRVVVGSKKRGLADRDDPRGRSRPARPRHPRVPLARAARIARARGARAPAHHGQAHTVRRPGGPEGRRAARPRRVGRPYTSGLRRLRVRRVRRPRAPRGRSPRGDVRSGRERPRGCRRRGGERAVTRVRRRSVPRRPEGPRGASDASLFHSRVRVRGDARRVGRVAPVRPRHGAVRSVANRVPVAVRGAVLRRGRPRGVPRGVQRDARVPGVGGTVSECEKKILRVHRRAHAREGTERGGAAVRGGGPGVAARGRARVTGARRRRHSERVRRAPGDDAFFFPFFPFFSRGFSSSLGRGARARGGGSAGGAPSTPRGGSRPVRGFRGGARGGSRRAPGGGRDRSGRRVGRRAGRRRGRGGGGGEGGGGGPAETRRRRRAEAAARGEAGRRGGEKRRRGF